MKDSQANILISVLFLIIIVLSFSIFTIIEGNRAFITRLGDIVTDSSTGQPKIYKPGIHFKIPFIDQVKRIDIKLQSFEEPTSRILTSEQNYVVIVDYYVKWRVTDLVTYFTRTGGRSIVAERLIQQKINDTLRAEFGTQEISDVISSERTQIMDLLKVKTNKRAKELGIEVIDVRIKKIDLPEEVSTSVFQNMRADRQRVATKHRSDGIAAAEALRSEADKDVIVIVAKANEDGAKLKAKGDSSATKVFSQAYSKNIKLFNLMRSLEAYEKSFENDKNNFIVLGPDSKFFDIMKNK